MATAALQKPMQPSAELTAVIGPGPHTRAEATAKLWQYIKDNGCQNPENKREVVADTKLRPVRGQPRIPAPAGVKWVQVPIATGRG